MSLSCQDPTHLDVGVNSPAFIHQTSNLSEEEPPSPEQLRLLLLAEPYVLLHHPRQCD